MSFEADAVQFEEGENVEVYIQSEGAVWLDGRIVEKTGLHWKVALNDGRVYRFEPRYIRKLNRTSVFGEKLPKDFVQDILGRLFK